MAIPKNINREHVFKAIQRIDREGIPERRESTRFNLSYDGKYYPPKYVISIANIFANGEEYSPSMFSGGDATNRFLRGLGFSITENAEIRLSQNRNNTWIFQGNPNVFDIDNYVKNNKYIWWSLRQEHYLNNIQIYDLVFLWRSDGGKRGTGGIIAKTKVVGLPNEITDDANAKEYWHTDDWKNPSLVVKLEVLDVKIEEGFINRLSLLEHPVLKDLLILRLRQQTNYLLPEAHAEELQKLCNSSNSNIGDVLDSNDLENLFANEITHTEKEQIIKSRIGQSAYKKALLAIQKKCGLCGISDVRFLVASHIKPWSQSNNQERLDINNGLLLCPNHDALFDKGFISFSDEGIIMISTSLDEATKVFLNVNENMNVETSKRQQEYMRWHRKNMFIV